MIEESKQAVLPSQVVAQKVADYLKDCHPDGVTLTVVPDSVHMGEFVWRVRVRPNREPSKPLEYYEALADVEIELEEREQLQVWLIPSDPLQPPSAEESAQDVDRKPAHRASIQMSPRWRKATKQAVARKVAEYLSDCHPSGMTLEVDADGIRKDDFWWDVPIVPDFEPDKLSEYYEALAAVTQELEERERLKVFLAPTPPKGEPGA